MINISIILLLVCLCTLTQIVAAKTLRYMTHYFVIDTYYYFIVRVSLSFIYTRIYKKKKNHTQYTIEYGCGCYDRAELW